MSSFFIERPIFACVMSLLIVLSGALSLSFLPLSQYPDIAPVTVGVNAAYPGASAERVYDGITRIIEEELNGIPGLTTFESKSDAAGLVEIAVIFGPGTRPADAAAAVQNRIRRVEARLPRTAVEQGIKVVEASTNFLQLVAVTSKDGALDEVTLGDLVARRILGELRRVPGVGRAESYAAEQALRIWIDPVKLLGLSLTPGDVTAAIRTQNAAIASGTLGAQPAMPGQRIAATVVVRGQLTSVTEFEQIILRANPNGSVVRLRDVARVEFGGLSYAFGSRLDGRPAAGIGIMLAPGSNAVATAIAVRATVAQLAKRMPPGVEIAISYDTTPFVSASVRQVLLTLAEAMALVFVVMFLFLQNIRYTLIPTIVVPIALMGTCTVMLLAGFSLNVLTMFGMVLAIGILVDDAIVVVENVERIMNEEGLPPKEATHKAMSQITGAIIGITLVLVAVFIPMAFFPGSVGIIYRQFSIAMVTSIAFSALLALTLTPALCATLLKPVEKGHGHAKGGILGWFRRGFARLAEGYGRTADGVLRRPVRSIFVYVALVGTFGLLYARLPSGFLPTEDQGYVMIDLQTPPEATAERTLDVVKRMERHFAAEPGVASTTSLTGFGLAGQGQNTAIAYITLKDWSKRGRSDTADAITARARTTLSGIKDAIVMTLQPPAIDLLGSSSGFSFRLQDRDRKGYAALASARDHLLKAAKRSPILQDVYIEALPTAPQIEILIDREKANALGVSLAAIDETLTTSLGSAYVNDFPNENRMQRVVVQADATRRMKAEDLLDLSTRNGQGQMVPIQSFARVHWMMGPSQIAGFNGYASISFVGGPSAGHTSGQAMAEMERLAGQLPNGFDYAWTAQSLEEKLSNSQAYTLLGLSLFCVFLCLAALYESWTIPFAVLLVVPVGLLGAVLALHLRDMPNDVYFKVGLVTIIGLTAKNAILIVELARSLVVQGRSAGEAVVEAATLRFRPILMTSFAFILGVLPLAVASGVSSGSQQAIGTSVLGGMVTATSLVLYFVPFFFIQIIKILPSSYRSDQENSAVTHVK